MHILWSCVFCPPPAALRANSRCFMGTLKKGDALKYKFKMSRNTSAPPVFCYWCVFTRLGMLNGVLQCQIKITHKKTRENSES